MNIRKFAGLIVCGLLPGCGPMAGSDHSSSPSTVYENVARSTGRKDVVIVVIPPSRGPIADATTQRMGEAVGEASLPRSVRIRLKSTKEEGLRAYVGGNSPRKVEWALREALSKSPSGSLRGLIIYTNAEMTEGLKESGRSAGATISKLDL